MFLIVLLRGAPLTSTGCMQCLCLLMHSALPLTMLPCSAWQHLKQSAFKMLSSEVSVISVHFSEWGR